MIRVALDIKPPPPVTQPGGSENTFPNESLTNLGTCVSGIAGNRQISKPPPTRIICDDFVNGRLPLRAPFREKNSFPGDKSCSVFASTSWLIIWLLLPRAPECILVGPSFYCLITLPRRCTDLPWLPLPGWFLPCCHSSTAVRLPREPSHQWCKVRSPDSAQVCTGRCCQLHLDCHWLWFCRKQCCHDGWVFSAPH